MEYQRELYIFKRLLQHLLGYIIIYTRVAVTRMASYIQYYSHKLLLYLNFRCIQNKCAFKRCLVTSI